MADTYAHIRSIGFPALCSALGIDPAAFKQRKGGQEYYGRCPLHEAKTNTTSFSYHADGRFNCFSCSQKGRGAIDFTRAVKGCGFQDAVSFLGTVQAPAKEEKPVLQQSGASQGKVKDYSQPLTKDTWLKYQVACEWLEKRIGSADVLKRYGVFCYDNPSRPKSIYRGRVMIPFRHHETGALYGYMGRAIEGEPKYLVPPEFPKASFLFGAYELRSGTSGQLPLRWVVLAESPFCVLKYAAHQIPCVSGYGWSVSDEQVEILATVTRGVLYIPDRNKHEQAEGCTGKLARRLWLKMPPLPDGIEDPEQLSPDAVRKLLL